VGDVLHELRERDVARKRAEIGMVFLRFNLFPHLTALENVAEAPVRVDTGAVIEHGPPGELIDRPRHDRTRAFLSKVL
jgi:polar amino acid transport system ATP-binding protein